MQYPSDSNRSRPINDRILSPLGWSVGTRLLWAAGASALLWLCVAWALR